MKRPDIIRTSLIRLSGVFLQWWRGRSAGRPTRG